MTRALEATRFLLELASLVAAAVAGAHVAWPLAVLAPVAVIVVWGRFVAPKARGRLADPARLALEVCLFVVLGVALAAAGAPWAGALLAVASIVVAGALRVVGSEA
ncbi:MAG: YrdB family protein [Acidimicrobiales bacterium]|nr:YrdB family protein [Acidimicrobiales bacterium]MCB9373747.1 YrdB family protein [Microthrixaceae bacterium]